MAKTEDVKALVTDISKQEKFDPAKARKLAYANLDSGITIGKFLGSLAILGLCDLVEHAQKESASPENKGGSDGC